MSKTKSSTDFIQMSKNENNFWDEATLEAEKQIEEAKKKIKILKNSIESFKILRESGEPFLSGDTGQNEAKS
jgi:hypothetical protein